MSQLKMNPNYEGGFSSHEFISNKRTFGVLQHKWSKDVLSGSSNKSLRRMRRVDPVSYMFASKMFENVTEHLRFLMQRQRPQITCFEHEDFMLVNFIMVSLNHQSQIVLLTKLLSLFFHLWDLISRSKYAEALSPSWLKCTLGVLSVELQSLAMPDNPQSNRNWVEKCGVIDGDVGVKLPRDLMMDLRIIDKSAMHLSETTELSWFSHSHFCQHTIEKFGTTQDNFMLLGTFSHYLRLIIRELRYLKRSFATLDRIKLNVDHDGLKALLTPDVALMKEVVSDVIIHIECVGNLPL